MRSHFSALGSVGLTIGLSIGVIAIAPSSLAAPVTVTFNTNGQSTWVVPSGVSSISVTLRGTAAGAMTAGTLKGAPGDGVSVTVTRAVAPTQIIDISLGAQRQNDCMYGGNNGSSTWTGEAAAVQLRGTSELVVAGGGGGPGCADPSTRVGGDGGDAGIPTGPGVANGGSGSAGSGGTPSATGGSGGTSTGGAGGTDGAGAGASGGNPATVYGLLGAGAIQDAANGAKGGAGGPGYAGGGAGASGNYAQSAAGGGGGSSYLSGSWALTSASVNTSAGAASVTITYTLASPTDADLTGLVTSSGSLSPGFTSGTTSYNAVVANGVSSVTVTPTASNAGASITVNGVVVISGQASGAISLSVGMNTITTVVTATDTTTTKTYTILITRTDADALSSQAPPVWYQAYSRPTRDSLCSEGYRPSYAQWPNDGRGGWTCERRLYIESWMSDWVEAPGFAD